MCLLIHAAKRCVRVLAQRIDFDSFVEGFSCLVILAVSGVSPADGAVGIFIVRIQFSLLLERCNRVFILTQHHVATAQVHPCGLMLRIGLDHALKQINGSLEVSTLIGSFGRIVKLVALQIGRKCGCTRRRTVNGKMLFGISHDGTAERGVITGAGRGKLVQSGDELAIRGKRVGVSLVAGLVVPVVAFHRERQGRALGVFRRKFKMQVIHVLNRRADLDRVGIVFISVGHADLGKRQHHVRLLFRPVEEIRGVKFVGNFERAVRVSRVAHVEFRDFSGHARVRTHVLHPLGPLIARDVAKEHTHIQLAISAEFVADVRA